MVGYVRELWRDAERRNWTVSPGGLTNSSELFEQLVEVIADIIRHDGYQLLAGNANATARLILAQLAHVHGLQPCADKPGAKE